MEATSFPSGDLTLSGVSLLSSSRKPYHGRGDTVLLETNDGRPHLQPLRPVLQAGKRVFIDKPIAGSLKDAIRIFQEA